MFVSVANVLGYYDNLPSPLPLPIKVGVYYTCMNVCCELKLHVCIKKGRNERQGGEKTNDVERGRERERKRERERES